MSAPPPPRRGPERAPTGPRTRVIARSAAGGTGISPKPEGPSSSLACINVSTPFFRDPFDLCPEAPCGLCPTRYIGKELETHSPPNSSRYGEEVSHRIGQTSRSGFVRARSIYPMKITGVELSRTFDVESGHRR